MEQSKQTGAAEAVVLASVMVLLVFSEDGRPEALIAKEATVREVPGQQRSWMSLMLGSA